MQWSEQIFYRVRQFWRGFTAKVDAAELESIRPLLTIAAYTLFLRLPVDAQCHSLNVLRDLQQRGTVGSDLAAAALLHDVGKLAAEDAGVRINLWLRGPLVLLKAFAPTIYQRLQSEDEQSGWRYALYVYEAHPQIGAAWANQTGCSELTCWLIAQHQMQLNAQLNKEAALLAELQWADARN